MTTTIGLKIITGLTGVVLSLFVLGHMAGNLQVFQGKEAINAYGRLLHKEPAILWTARLVLLTAVGLHIWAYLALGRRNDAARPVGYRLQAHRASTYASRSMRLTGPLLLAFIVYHIHHLTTGTTHPDYHEGDVYANLVRGLKVVWVSAFYLLAMGALGFHLWHGVYSLSTTLGVTQPRYRRLWHRAAIGFTALVVLGFSVIPVAVLAGVIK